MPMPTLAKILLTFITGDAPPVAAVVDEEVAAIVGEDVVVPAGEEEADVFVTSAFTTEGASLIAVGIICPAHSPIAMAASSHTSIPRLSHTVFSHSLGHPSCSSNSAELCAATQAEAVLVKDWQSARSDFGTAVESLFVARVSVKFQNSSSLFLQQRVEGVYVLLHIS